MDYPPKDPAKSLDAKPLNHPKSEQLLQAQMVQLSLILEQTSQLSDRSPRSTYTLNPKPYIQHPKPEALNPES